jgi:hypothetical protein
MRAKPRAARVDDRRRWLDNQPIALRMCSMHSSPFAPRHLPRQVGRVPRTGHPRSRTVWRRVFKSAVRTRRSSASCVPSMTPSRRPWRGHWSRQQSVPTSARCPAGCPHTRPRSQPTRSTLERELRGRGVWCRFHCIRLYHHGRGIEMATPSRRGRFRRAVRAGSAREGSRAAGPVHSEMVPSQVVICLSTTVAPTDDAASSFVPALPS